MSNSTMLNFTKPNSSPCPANGGPTVGDGALTRDTVLAVCRLQGADDMYYYSTTFSGGPEKCPPDRGSSDWVTASPAPYRPSPLALSPLSSRASSASASDADSVCELSSPVYPPTPPLDADDAASDVSVSFFPTLHAFPTSPPTHAGGATGGGSLPKSIPASKTGAAGLATPPLTPPDDSGSTPGAPAADDALDILSTLFPRDALAALPHAQRVAIDAPQLGAAIAGVVLALPGAPRTLYVDGQAAAAAIDLRQSIVALLDLADERLACGALVIALERSAPGLGELLHALMYVGGTVVTKPPFEVDPAFVMVGMEI